MSNETPENLRWQFVLRLAGLAGALSLIGLLVSATDFASNLWDRYIDGYKELPGSFAGERWRETRPLELVWLQGEWCYPSIRGFHSRFRLGTEGGLERQNVGKYPDAFVTRWVHTQTNISNHGLLRIKYLNEDWPIDFVHFEAGKPAEWRENGRSQHDDGSVTSDELRLVLSCSRCKVNDDGLTYKCK